MPRNVGTGLRWWRFPIGADTSQIEIAAPEAKNKKKICEHNYVLEAPCYIGLHFKNKELHPFPHPFKSKV